MTILEKQEERLNLQTELDNLIKQGEAETRELNDTENARIAEIRTSIDAIDAEIKALEEENKKLAKEQENRQINKENKQSDKMEMRLFDLIKGIANGNVTDEMRSFVNGNVISFRNDIQATGNGQENVPTYKQPLEVAIRNASVLDKLGVRWFNNAVGDIKLVKYDGSNTYWADAENAEALSGEGAFTEITLSPKRLSSTITISRQFLAQSPEDAESILIADLAKAVAEKIDMTLFGAESGTTARPEGLFYSAATLASSAITFDDILDIEKDVELKNGVDYVFVTNPSYKQALRGTQMASGLEMVFRNGEIDGQKTIVSNSVAGIGCFDPSDVACATWMDGMNITIDPYSLAAKNQIKVVVNYLFDGKKKGDRMSFRKDAE